MLNSIASEAIRYKLSNLEKYKTVETICRLEIARAKMMRANDITNYSPKTLLDYKEKEFFSKKLLRVLECLTKEQRHLIKNEFLNKDKKKFWYEDFYSKTTYYKRRSEAVNDFLLLYIDHI